MENRPYTTAELAEKFAQRGIKLRGAYVSVVIHNPKRKTPHPLLAAHIARGMWDKEIVDEYFKTASPTPPRGGRSKSTP